MTRAARAVRRRPRATSWAQIAGADLDKEQARLAAATTALLAFEGAALDAFGYLLRGEKSCPKSTLDALCSRAAATRATDPFPSSWVGSSAPFGDSGRYIWARPRKGPS